MLNWKAQKPRLRTLLSAAVTLLALASCGQNNATPTTDAATAPNPGLTDQATATNGLTGVYYDNMDFTGKTVTQVDATINKNWGTKSPVTGIAATTYSVRWTGQIQPAYSETYTFFLTSSGGARLIVNGQLVVNDWTDHASKVSSGTIEFIAGQKYDIRIDYYRNTANAGSVKLEWSSAKQTRQTVPQAKFFPTGSNTATALNILKQSPKIIDLKLDFDVTSAYVTLTNGVYIVRTNELNSNNFIFSTIKQGVVLSAYRFEFSTGILTITSLNTGRRSQIQNPESLVNSDGTYTSSQAEILATGILSVLDENYLGSDRAPKVITSQGVSSLVCNGGLGNTFLQLASPTSCIQCQAQADKYRDDICSLVGPIGDVAIYYILLRTFGPKVANLTGLPSIIHDGVEYLSTINNVQADWQAYLNCIAGKIPGIVGCPPILDPTPTPARIEIYAAPTASGYVQTAFGSSINSKSALFITTVWTKPGAYLTSSSIPSAWSLHPGDMSGVTVSYDCSASVWTGVKILEGEFSVYSNDPNHPSNPVQVIVHCGGSPKIATTTPAPITALVGETKSTTFDISNIGDPGSTLTYSLTPSGGIRLSKSSGNLTKSDATVSPSDTITASYTCTSAGIVTPAPTVTITSNDPDRPSLTETLSVKCDINLHPIIIEPTSLNLEAFFNSNDTAPVYSVKLTNPDPVERTVEQYDIAWGKLTPNSVKIPPYGTVTVGAQAVCNNYLSQPVGRFPMKIGLHEYYQTADSSWYEFKDGYITGETLCKSPPYDYMQTIVAWSTFHNASTCSFLEYRAVAYVDANTMQEKCFLKVEDAQAWAMSQLPAATAAFTNYKVSRPLCEFDTCDFEVQPLRADGTDPWVNMVVIGYIHVNK